MDLPNEIIVYIASFTNNAIDLKLLNKDIYNEILKEERLDNWKLKYMNKMVKITNCPALEDSLNWKYDYCCIMRDGYFDLFEGWPSLKDLKALDVRNKKIMEIPNEIETLKNLWVLDMGRNQIKKISVELCGLIALKNLMINNNLIRVIPDEIGNLVNLTVLRIENNPIKGLPKELKNLVKLDFFVYGGNYIEINEDGRKYIENYRELFGCLNFDGNHLKRIDFVDYEIIKNGNVTAHSKKNIAEWFDIIL